MPSARPGAAVTPAGGPSGKALARIARRRARPRIEFAARLEAVAQRARVARHGEALRGNESRLAAGLDERLDLELRCRRRRFKLPAVAMLMLSSRAVTTSLAMLAAVESQHRDVLRAAARPRAC